MLLCSPDPLETHCIKPHDQARTLFVCLDFDSRKYAKAATVPHQVSCPVAVMCQPAAEYQCVQFVGYQVNVQSAWYLCFSTTRDVDGYWGFQVEWIAMFLVVNKAAREASGGVRLRLQVQRYRSIRSAGE